MCDDFDFPIYDLSQAEAGSKLHSLRFDETKYTSLEEFIPNLSELPKRKVRVKKGDLGVNGRAVADKMEYYLAAKGESSSALKQALITPRHYVIYKDPRIGREKKHFTLGTFCHSAFLEPKLFEKVKVQPEVNLSKNADKITFIEWYWEQLGITPECVLSEKNRDELNEIIADCEKRFTEAGYKCIDAESVAIIDIIRKTYKTYGGGILPKLLSLADAEISFYYTDESTGLPVKVRPDAMLLEENIGLNICVSLKTTGATTIEQFARDAAKFKYDLSEGMYLDVMSNVTGRVFSGTLMIVLQTVQPWQIFALWWDAEDLESGRYKYRQALEMVAECKEKKSFPGFDVRAEDGACGIIQFRLPEYARLTLPEQNV